MLNGELDRGCGLGTGELARLMELREDVWDAARLGGRRGCNGGSAALMRSQVSSELDWTLSCLWAGWCGF